MEKSPIQVVLNSQNFVDIWERTAGGSFKDFFEGRDKEFVEHQQKLIEQLSDFKTEVQSVTFNYGVQYAKVKLRASALAKSHRPNSIFNDSTAPVIGGGDLGEVFVELRNDSIDKIDAKIKQAEEVPQLKFDTKRDKDIAQPSKYRSAVGAIDELSLHLPSDKRNFSIKDGLDWLKNKNTGGGYIIELFEKIPQRNDWDLLPGYKFKLVKSFIDGLDNLPISLRRNAILNKKNDSFYISLKIIEERKVEEQESVKEQEKFKVQQTSLEVDSHKTLIEFLENHPIVKRILLPPIIEACEFLGTEDNNTFSTIPERNPNIKYPKVGVIDGGISSILDSWVTERWNFTAQADKDEKHATFISGLLVAGSQINGNTICNENDGCEIIDIDILPEKSFEKYYFDPLDFFKELETAVSELKKRTGARIYNFSINTNEHASTQGYSIVAQLLDDIAIENDVIFVISAGNLDSADFRKEWSIDPISSLSSLANSKNDIITTPAESFRNISVAALNPPNLNGIIPFAPANYSRRGPGVKVGLKPDFAHIGGAGQLNPGLQSFDQNGGIIGGSGTSYAAPNVAKIMANVENKIEGDISRETLIGLMVHNSNLPLPLQDGKLREVAKHLVGFGMPVSSDEILEGKNNQITLLFSTRLTHGKKMTFKFNWPPSLIKNGKCIGKAKLTIVSTPHFNHKFGSEFIRVNIEGHLRQEQKDGKYGTSELKPVYVSDLGESNKQLEKNLIKYSLKWSPIKVYEAEFKRGKGQSDNWQLDIDYLERDGETIPDTGIPFSAILTIEAPEDNVPIFNEMRQQLQSIGVSIVDIKTAARVNARV